MRGLGAPALARVTAESCVFGYLVLACVVDWLQVLGAASASGIVKVGFLAACVALRLGSGQVEGTFARLNAFGICAVVLLFLTLSISQMFHVGDVQLNAFALSVFLLCFLLLGCTSWEALFHVFRRFAVFFVVFTVATLVVHPIEELMTMQRLSVPLGVNSNAAILVFLLPFLWLGRPSPSGSRVPAGLLTGVILVLLVWCKTRTALVILAVYWFIVVMQPWRSPWRANFRALGMTAVTGLLLLPFIPAASEGVIFRGQSADRFLSLSGRTDLWRVMISRILENPWVGLGQSGASVKLWNYRANWFFRDEGLGAHNLYLDLAVTQGLVVAGVVAGFVVVALLIHLFRLSQRGADPDLMRVRAMALLVVLAGAIHSMTESSSLLPTRVQGVLFWSACLVAFSKERGGVRSPQRDRRASTAEQVALLEAQAVNDGELRLLR